MANKYVRVTKGLDDSGKLIAINDINNYITDPNSDYYISTYNYTDKDVETFNKNGGTVKGIGNLYTNKLCFDFDNKIDLNLARKDALTLVNRLRDGGFPDESIDIYFSGGKGFHVEALVENDLNKNQVDYLCIEKYGKGLETLDTQIYNYSRIFRAPNTKHPKSGLFKYQLSIAELNKSKIEVIKENAKTIRTINKKQAVDVPDELLYVPAKRLVRTHEKIQFDIDKRPIHWKDYKWALLNAFGLKPNERHEALMVIAATCRGLGYDETMTRALCFSFDEKYQALTKEPPVEDLEDNVLPSVFSKDWEGGTYSYKNNKWLQGYCERIKIAVNNTDDEDVINIYDVREQYINFVKHIEENTIKTGIKRLDEALPITVGMNLGIVGAASSGKCLGRDTPIRMFDGSIKMVQDINVGDLLMGDDSTERLVLSTCRGFENLYKINQLNGDPYIVNSSHILSLKTNENKGNYQKNDIIDINIEEYNKKSKDFKDRFKGYKVGVNYKEQELEIDPYYLGLWLGDGSSYGTYLYTIDPEIVEYNKNYAKELGLSSKIYIDKRTNVKTTKILQSKNKSNYLRTNMINLGLLKNIKNKENHKHIPKKYLINNRTNRLKLLAGLIDSDGHCKVNSSCYTIVQKSFKLSKNILELSRSLGFKSTLTKTEKCATNGSKIKGTYYTVYISSNDYEDLNSFIKLERKKAQKNIRKNVLTTSLSIENLGEGHYYGFEIDGNHRFLLGDFTVTHNTAIALEILKNTSEAGVISVFASLDMHRNRLFEKLLYKVSNLPRAELYKLIQEDKAEHIMELVRKEYKNVWFYDRSCPSVADIRSYVRKVEEKTGQKVKMIMVDYFERVNSDKSEDTAASKEVAGQLQDIINDFNVAMITLVQPNKFSLAGGPDTPITNYTAIKGSSFLYQSFRSIISIWRPFFTPETKDDDKYLSMAILKNDLGELGLFNFSWDGRKGEITEFVSDEAEAYFEALLKEKNNRKNEKNDEF